MTTNTAHTNRLIHEQSGYLLQHAHNPVNWCPWGEEAFIKARSENKPIFLSIGYSTCHWCHVMAHESFENEETAALLNAHFVSVKVDREERPDIDEVYMGVCQALTGSGGWPLSIFMTPDKKPFYAGTYFPPHGVYGRMGFPEILERIAEAWKTKRDVLVAQSDEICKLLLGKAPRVEVDYDAADLIEKGVRALQRMFDDVHGGFSQAPKFPMPHYISFLLMYDHAYKSKRAVEMALFTLKKMVRGGIFDHVGYGFSRYSTDETWLVPHFEKMLYDNALLLKAYSEGYAVTGGTLCRDAAQKIAAYVLREMRSPEGAFFSAQDADSEGVEGKYYVWSYDELERVLTPGELSLLETEYGLTQSGNFEGQNILHRSAEGLADAAAEAVLQKLYEIRSSRVPPFKDTKISASWNGLMIEALSEAGMLLSRDDYIEAACRAADFMLDKMISSEGNVIGIYKKPDAGFLADYANTACALHRLYSATRNIRYLQYALSIVDAMTDRFFDPGDGRFYMAGRSEELFIRPRDEYDGAMPSGAASALTALSGLYHLSGKDSLKKILDTAIDAFLPEAETSPVSHVHFLSAILTRTVPHRQIVIAAGPEDGEALRVYRSTNAHYAPFTTVLHYDGSQEMRDAVPELENYNMSGSFTAFVCEDFTCGRPLYSAEALMERLGF